MENNLDRLLEEIDCYMAMIVAITSCIDKEDEKVFEAHHNKLNKLID